VNRHRVHDQAVIGVHHHGRRVVVAGHRVTASLLFVAQAVPIFIVDAVAVAVEVVSRWVDAIATVDGGVHIIVAGQLLGATHTTEVTGSIIQGGRHVVVASSSVRATCTARELAHAIVDRGRLIVIAGRFVRTALAACVLTRSVIVGRVGVVVARPSIRAPDGLVFITDSVIICIVDAVAIAIEKGVGRVCT